MLLYRTAAREASCEQEIERSRFIAYIAPVSSKEEGDAFVARIRAKHKDATHNVPAMVIGDKMQIQWASDDGEPQGTSGAPMVQLLVSEGITNVCVVVTRYFGGIKLGTGGLVRAYTSSAKLALEAAGIREVREMVELDVILEYTYLARVENMIREKGYDIEDTTYEDRVRMRISCLAEDAEYLKKQLAELTGGTFEIVSENEKNA